MVGSGSSIKTSMSILVNRQNSKNSNVFGVGKNWLCTAIFQNRLLFQNQNDHTLTKRAPRHLYDPRLLYLFLPVKEWKKPCLKFLVPMQHWVGIANRDNEFRCMQILKSTSILILFAKIMEMIYRFLPSSQ